MLNDTFDFLALSNITSPVPDLPRLETDLDTQKKEIFFDDSFFLTSQDLPALREHPTERVSGKNTSLADYFLASKSFSFLQTTQPKVAHSESFTLNSILDDSANIFDSSTDTVSAPNMRLLSAWGLPDSILQKYASRKVTSMFDWQVECLKNPKILKHHANLVYSAPTSAGKTLVAEILAIKTVLERSKKVIFILPFVSVVREKMFYFQDIFRGSGVRVEGFMGSYNPPGGFQSVQLAVCTIEKANSLINSFLLEGSLGQIGAVILDEMHLIGEPNRGYILELLLTKLRYITRKEASLDIQIIGMSATLPNLQKLAVWLDAELYITDFRPIPLYEQALISGALYDTRFDLIRTIEPLKELETDTDHILQLCLETITSNCSVLIFCPTKNWCENLAQQIATAFWKLGSTQSQLSQDLRQQLKTNLISEVLEQLKRCPVGLDAILRKSVSFGVAFHHAGLTLDERDIIEGAFRNSSIRVLVATSTLSSGVNLPARRVIIRTPIFHGKPIDSLTYRQMIGRAGRMGKDTSGESILICQRNEEKFARSLMSEELRSIESCLEGEGKLKRAILEIIASGVASSPEDVELFTQCTLLAQNDNFENPIEEALQFLVNNEFLKLEEVEGEKKYQASALGKACLASSIPPEDGLALFTELEKARQCFVLETELHLIYLVTPYSACHQWGNIDWMFYLDLWEKLPASMKRVGELIGVRESYLVSATRGKLQTNTNKLYHKFLIHKRFFVALALQDLVNEKPLSEVCSKFNCNRGMLQTLQLTASTFAGMVTSFSKQLGWSSVELLIAQFQDRLHFGVSRDLLDLMRLPILNGKCARALFNGGLESLVQIANSDIECIEKILLKVTPFESGKKRDGESDYAVQERNKMRMIWITGKEGLTEKEAAELILTSARDFLRLEMGLKEAKWESRKAPEGERPDLNYSDGSLFETSMSESAPRNISRHSLNSSGDVIVTSQDESYFSFEKTPSSSRKRLRKTQTLLVDESPCKKTKFEIEIIEVATQTDLEEFRKKVKLQTCIALAVGCSLAREKRRIIGLTPNTIEEKYSYKNQKVEGFAISWSEYLAYFLNLSKLENLLEFLKTLVSRKDLTILIFDAKEQIKVLKRCCDLELSCKLEDPKIADWLLEPEGREKSLLNMVKTYCPNLTRAAQKVCPMTRRSSSIALDVSSQNDPKQRASLEAVATLYLVPAIKSDFESTQFAQIYETEMSCLRLLSRMELTGINTDKLKLTKLVEILQYQLNELEKKAFSLAGRRFSLSSTKQVAKILGFEGKKISTKKQILEKCENPIAELVLKWRKINSIVIKMIQPLIRSIENGKIFGCSIMHTATGRISMHEPNLQSVAKNFNLEGVKISCRDAFFASDGSVLVSADYCQLELRLLAHFAQDEVLCRIMRGQGDVFKSIAARWSNVSEEEVTNEMRQNAKQISYGIIYGMGAKTLSEQLSIDENQASVFMESFRDAYPGLKSYIRDVIEKCQKSGYVETLAGRRRHLPHITHRNPAIRSQAERQAVNTTIQGSAADLVKKSMLELERQFGGSTRLVLHLHDELVFEVLKTNLGRFISILKKTMEEAVNLSIPFPVKVKIGQSWGQLTEYKM